MATKEHDFRFDERPAELLRQLIRFDTTNPPGNEAACVSLVRGHPPAPGRPAEGEGRRPAVPQAGAR